jgi:hypothetical protein
LLTVLPHIKPLDNYFEISNELGITLLMYSMFGFMDTSLLEASEQWEAGKYVQRLIMLVFLINIGLILFKGGKGTLKRVRRCFAQRRANKVLAAELLIGRGFIAGGEHDLSDTHRELKP